MAPANDSQPLVARGLNLDTLLRYASRVLRSPLPSFIAVSAITRGRPGIRARDKAAVASALWIAVVYALPATCRLAARLLGPRRRPVQWADEVVVVTGGSHGVGLELTTRLLAAGARVAVVDVNPIPPLVEAGSGGQVRWYGCDVTDLEQVKGMADRIRAELGDPTMLVNNAGIVVGKLLLDMTDNEVDKVVNVNLTSHFHLIRQFLPAMLRCGRGHIVSIGSVVSFAGMPQGTTYCATKGGVKMLHESLRREIASRYEPNNIQFTIAYPGVIDTGMFAGLQLGQFLLPNLRPDAPARVVFAALESGKGQEIYLPAAAHIVRALYLLPPGARAGILNLVSGSDSAMAKFAGHTKY
ncbi:hypothetical protein H4R19_003902 [Coemansia spiralis]|nr:hypothetical protein H4R19_003902 [Coemansia spiralis]